MALFFRTIRGLLVGLTVVACHEIAGIEERELDIRPSPLCEKYCSTVNQNCSGKNAVYASEATCYGVCARLPLGDENEPKDENTVSCRLQRAKHAAMEPDEDCRFAGPGGHGDCGENCEAYCGIRQGLCAQEFEESECVRLCGGLVDREEYSTNTDQGGPNIQCRLWHISAATASDTLVHCGHAQLLAAKPDDPCANKPGSVPSCEEFCKLSLVVCSGENQVYENQAQCEEVCERLDPGKHGDPDGRNTVACRHYHTRTAMQSKALAKAHCTHSGPGGDGHCGLDNEKPGVTGNCESYCMLFKAACTAEFAAYGTDDACLAACGKVPGAAADSGYNTAAKGNTLACRLLHTSKAFSDPSECASAAGGGVCK